MNRSNNKKYRRKQCIRMNNLNESASKCSSTGSDVLFHRKRSTIMNKVRNGRWRRNIFKRLIKEVD